jgi:uncharacterized membrane protein
MEFLIFISLIVLIAVVIATKNTLYSRLSDLQKEIFRLREQISALQLQEEKPAIKAKPDTLVTPIVPSSPVPDPKPTIHQPERNVEPIPMMETQETSTMPEYQTVPVQRRQGFFERHPDLEKFIGENLISKIGIAVLVLGIGFFVKYAIDNNWIGPIGRVAIGLLCGAILVTVAHFLRKSYEAFSSILIGGGIAVFYFTFSLAFHDYQLFSQPVAFAIMVIVTCFAVLLSILYSRQELAIIALVGGFIAPFLVTKGSGNYVALFLYLLILNAGLLVLALRKAWRLLNLLAFLFTSILFGSWLFALNEREPQLTFRNGLLFATGFYLLFFVINIIHNVKEKKKFIASDFGILLANTCLYFSAGLYCLKYMGATEYQGMFCMSLGIFNLAATYFLFRKSKVDTNILYLLIGITLTFISLTAPVQLKGNHITLFWASEAVLLYWLYQKSRIKMIQLASSLVWIAMLISLLIDLGQAYGLAFKTLPIVFNRGFLTIIFAAASTYILYILRGRDIADPGAAFPWFAPPKSVFRIVALALLYGAGFFEINYQFDEHYPGTNIGTLYVLLYTFVFIAILVNISSRFVFFHLNKRVTAALLSVAILLYLLYIGQSFQIQKQILAQPQLNYHFVAHWLGTCVLGILLIQTIRFYRSVITDRNEWMTWLICMVIVIYFTAETHLLLNQIFYNGEGSLANIQRVFIKAGWPILWGLSSFGFMWIGMKKGFRLLRVISLSLFTVTLIKLFAYDIVNIPAGGKIAAFFSLGVLLLIVSFMYQRLKKIIIDDEVIAK